MTILEAVRAVKHRPNCGAVVHTRREGYDQCDCDRDERVAKGIDAATDAAHRNGEANGSADAWGAMIDTDLAIGDGRVAVVAAFVKATAL